MAKSKFKSLDAPEKDTYVCKIELEVLPYDNKSAEEKIKELVKIHVDCTQMANRMVNEFHFNMLGQGRIARNEFIFDKLQKNRPKKERDLSKEEQKKLEELEKKLAESKREIFNIGVRGESCSDENAGYAMASLEYGHTIPSQIITSMNRSVFKRMNTDRKEILEGKKAVPHYKRNSPIPFNIIKKGESFPIKYKSESDDFILVPFRGFAFKMVFGKDKSNNRSKVESILAGHYTMCDSALEIEYKNDNSYIVNKVFLKLMFSVLSVKRNGEKTAVMGVDIGINSPLSYAIQDTLHRGHIGTRKEFYHHKVAFGKMRSVLQKSLTVGAVSGNGRNKKILKLSELRKKDRDWTSTMNHRYSSEIIKIALANNVGVIKLENITGINVKFKLLKNWPYYELQSKIAYKAKRCDIDVIYINPANTSTNCCKCGEKGERSKSDYDQIARMTVEQYKALHSIPGEFNVFTCKNPICEVNGKNVNADVNAAYNIAASKNYSKKKNSSEVLESVE